MLDPDHASTLVNRYFAEADSERFRTDVGRLRPQEDEADITADVEESEGGQLLLLPERSPIPLTAYLASALTGLKEHERQLIFQLSDSISMVCAEYGIDVYEPRKQTDPVHHADVEASQVFRLDRERVLGSDLIIHLTHFPSTGAGEELDFAHSALLPILLVSHGDTRVSRMVRGIPGLKVEIVYTEPEELRSVLRSTLLELRPVLEERKLAFAEYEVNIVGEKVRMLREAQGLTRAELAGSGGRWLSEDTLVQLEESTDRLANPSLMQLRQLAALLNTTVAELVEPDLAEQLVATLRDLMEEPTAARFSGITSRDRNRLLRAMLQRMTALLDDAGG